MHRDVATLGSQHTLVARKYAIYGRGVCLRATHEEHHLGIFATYLLAYKRLGMRGVLVVAIAYGVLEVCLHKALQNLWMRTRSIV